MHLELVEARENQVIIWPDDPHPSVFILFKGRVRKTLYSLEEKHLVSIEFIYTLLGRRREGQHGYDHL